MVFLYFAVVVFVFVVVVIFSVVVVVVAAAAVVVVVDLLLLLLLLCITMMNFSGYRGGSGVHLLHGQIQTPHGHERRGHEDNNILKLQTSDSYSPPPLV